MLFLHSVSLDDIPSSTLFLRTEKNELIEEQFTISKLELLNHYVHVEFDKTSFLKKIIYIFSAVNGQWGKWYATSTMLLTSGVTEVYLNRRRVNVYSFVCLAVIGVSV